MTYRLTGTIAVPQKRVITQEEVLISNKDYLDTDFPFADMSVGDSFLVQVPYTLSANYCQRVVSSYSNIYKQKPSHLFTVRLTAKGVRCWRTN